MIDQDGVDRVDCPNCEGSGYFEDPLTDGEKACSICHGASELRSLDVGQIIKELDGQIAYWKKEAKIASDALVWISTQSSGHGTAIGRARAALESIAHLRGG